jgi:imidazolonepropionase
VKTLAVIGCSQLVTLAGPNRPRLGAEMAELSVIENGAMLVQEGQIVHVGLRNDIEPMIGAETQVVDTGGCVVLPGYVDAHTHPVFGGNRSDEFVMRSSGATYEEIAASGGGIQSTVRKTRAASEEELFHVGLTYANWFLTCGTTTVEAKSGYGLSLESELKILRVIRRLNGETPLTYIPTFLGAHALPPEFQGDAGAYMRIIMEEMLPEVERQQLAEYCDVFCEAGYFAIEQATAVLRVAKAHGLKGRIHADQLSRCGGAEVAAEVGAATADHLEQLDDSGIEALRSGSVQPVLLPGSVYGLGKSCYPPARKMIEAGLAVVLATDFNPGSSPVPSIPMIQSLACTHMRMSPAEALCATTMNAACSLDRQHEIGSLEAGKKANFVVHDVADYREIPYFFGLPHAKRVFVEGIEVLV